MTVSVPGSRDEALTDDIIEAAAKVLYQDNLEACADYEAPAWDELPDVDEQAIIQDKAVWLAAAERALAAVVPRLRAHIADEERQRIIDELLARRPDIPPSDDPCRRDRVIQRSTLNRAAAAVARGSDMMIVDGRNERFFLSPNARGYECLWLQNEAAPHQPIELLSEFDFPAPSRTEAWRFVRDAVAARVARGGDHA
jgi:hypothetical protein